MRNIQTIWVAPADQPQVHISDMAAYEANAQVVLDAGSAVRIAANDPAALRALARSFDEAAVRLSATLDARAAREINATAGAA